MRFSLTLFSVVYFLLCTSCLPQEEDFIVDGLAPIYASSEDFSLIYSTSPKESIDQGSFLEINEYIYINERFKGIHVFDNSDPTNPIKMYFWNIPGNTEFTIDENYLYADNSRHLLTIDISDPADIKYLSYIKDVYTPNMENENYPRNYFGHFECVEFDEGIVVDWEFKELVNPKCRIL